jgi:hypothetical protein
MKIIYSLLGICISVSLFAQVEIVSTNLPDANDVLIQENATLLTDVNLEIAGPDAVWSFDFDVLQPLNQETTTNCLDLASTPITYQFLFNNPFDADHNSDFAIGVDEFSVGATFTVEDAYFYYQNRSDRYAITGMGATLTGIPLGTQADPVDVIYELPLNYEDTSASDSEILFQVPETFTYRLQQSRSNVVDGWGTINIWGQSFDVLRVRTEIEANDSVYINFISNGFAIDRPLTVEYKWLSPLYKVPVLQINTAGGIVTQTLVADIYTAIEEQSAIELNVFPNPATDFITLQGNVKSNATMEVYNAQGQKMLSGMIPTSRQLDVSSWNAGMYFIAITQDGQRINNCVVIE